VDLYSAFIVAPHTQDAEVCITFYLQIASHGVRACLHLASVQQTAPPLMIVVADN